MKRILTRKPTYGSSHNNDLIEEGMDFEISNTPITKYKTRRKLMTEQKLLSRSEMSSSEHSSASNPRGSFSK